MHKMMPIACHHSGPHGGSGDKGIIVMSFSATTPSRCFMPAHDWRILISLVRSSFRGTWSSLLGISTKKQSIPSFSGSSVDCCDYVKVINNPPFNLRVLSSATKNPAMPLLSFPLSMPRIPTVTEINYSIGDDMKHTDIKRFDACT